MNTLEDFLVQNSPQILTTVTAVCGAIIAVVAFLRSLKSERRTITRLNETEQKIVVTREGVVEAFKTAAIPEELKVSINQQVEHILRTELGKIKEVLLRNDEIKTKLNYYSLQILEWTAASNKLSEAQKAEIKSLLSMLDDTNSISTGK